MRLGWPYSDDWYPYRRENLTQAHRGRKPCDHRGGEWSAMCTSQGTSKIAGNHQKLGERPGTDSLPEPPEETHPADTLILEFWLPGL